MRVSISVENAKTDLTEVKPSILLVAAKWWPLSARMATAFLKNGCSVSAICPMPHPIVFVEGLDAIFKYRSSNSLESLRNAILSCRPDAIVPCDDGAASQCRFLYESDTSLRPLLVRSLGASASYSILDSRYAFLKAAEGFGLKIPKTRRVKRHEDLAEWHDLECGKAVIKVDGDSGGNGVRICDSLSESVSAWKSLRTVPSRLAAFKRITIDRDPLAFWLRTRPREVTVQEYIEGRPANTMVAAWQGRMLGLLSVNVLAADGPTGAATIVQVNNDPRMRQAARVISERLQLSGFFGLDFVIQSSDETPYLIEINPRCTQLGHIELAVDRSLARVFSDALRGETSAAEAFELLSSQRIALFPQALAGGAGFKSLIDSSYHDVPVGQSDLAAELLRGARPQRQLLSRLYHAFNPVKQQSPTVYEATRLVTSDVTTDEFSLRTGSG